MKRLLKISLNSFIFSCTPILSWFMLGLLVNKNLINIFSLTYPIQFIYSLMTSVFGTGPNICKEKLKDKNSVMSGIVLGTVIGFFIFGLIAINIDSYISFMHMDANIYHDFGTFSVIQLYLQSIFAMILEKCYFEDKNVQANFYMIGFNVSCFCVLIGMSLLTKNTNFIIITTLLFTLLYVLIIFIREMNSFRFRPKMFTWIKYDSVDICDSILFFLIYFFGLSNAIEYGENYMLALNFVALITDMQWDSIEAIATVAKIDISKNTFNYKEHRKNAYQLLVILLSSSLLLGIIMYPMYSLDIKLVAIYFSIELATFIAYPPCRIKMCFLQLEYSSAKSTANMFIASVSRFLFSFLNSPFCTGIGQFVSLTYEYISYHIMFRKNYKVEKNGKIKVLHHS